MTDTTIAKIQIRRGSQADLPALDEGELAYALDSKRLFIGNTIQRFTADGISDRFTILDSTILPTQIRVLVDSEEHEYVTVVTPGPINFQYGVVESDIVFASAPAAGAIVEIYYNSEIQLARKYNPNKVIQLEATGLEPVNTGISWPISGPDSFNSAVVSYSFKNTAGDMSLGEIKIIHNGTDAASFDSGAVLGLPGLTLDAVVDEDTSRLYVRYTNTSGYAGNFYYDIKLWNTI